MFIGRLHATRLQRSEAWTVYNAHKSIQRQRLGQIQKLYLKCPKYLQSKTLGAVDHRKRLHEHKWRTRQEVAGSLLQWLGANDQGHARRTTKVDFWGVWPRHNTRAQWCRQGVYGLKIAWMWNAFEVDNAVQSDPKNPVHSAENDEKRGHNLCWPRNQATSANSSNRTL